MQYGVTRERLAEIADDSDGWDVLHLSGHGTAGTFLLERMDGSPDMVPAADLVALLRPAKRRAKLAVVSSCESAVGATAETYRLLGLTVQAEDLEAQAREVVQHLAMVPHSEMSDSAMDAPPPALVQRSAIPGLARALVRELGCAVVAMRYPVQDEFAIAFVNALYENLLSSRLPVDLAAARATAAAAEVMPSATGPPVSLVTPVLFGEKVVGLRLDAPRGRPVTDPAEQRLAYFPDEPSRFVGRAEEMARASAALSPRSGQTGVLLHGIVGGGKTICALELAYRHADSFAAAVFWQAPVREDEWAAALPDLTNRLDVQLADYGFSMAGHIGTTDALEAFLPRLRQTLGDNSVLLVLDNLETLLTPNGDWRDSRWQVLVNALTGHDGKSRVIMSSRIAPASSAPGVLTLPVHALSLSESVALATELPNLRALLHADAGPAPASFAYARVDMDDDRERVRRVLRVVQGHPKLMELADATAADRRRLDAHLTAAEEAAAGQSLEAFFRDGASALGSQQFLDVLARWTGMILAGLPEPTRLMALFLACMDTGDRQSTIVSVNWADLWRRLERPGEPPEPRQALRALASVALIQLEALEETSDDAATQDLVCQMHPAVANTVAPAVGDPVRAATDIELGTFWQTVAWEASVLSGGENTGVVVRAALAAVPYLLRQEAWDAAAALLEQVLSRDHSPVAAQFALPALRRVADATGAPRDVAVLARVLATVDPVEGERLQREVLDAALSSADFRLAASATGSLISLLASTGRLAEALELTPRLEDCAQRAALGPWTLAASRAIRLQVLGMMGEHSRLLEEGTALHQGLVALPRTVSDEETVQPWNVYEAVLDTTRNSAIAVADWRLALDLSNEITASMRGRAAGAHEIAATLLTDAGPLIRMGRLTEAGRLLSDCQRVFEEYADTIGLARVLSARATFEAALGHQEVAMELERAALRLLYARVRHDPVSIAASHHNLAGYVFASGGEDHVVLCHRMAAALIFRLTGATHDLASTLRAAARSLRAQSRPGNELTLTDVISVVEQTEGVHLMDLIAAIRPDPAAESAFAELLVAIAEPALIEPDEDERQALPVRSEAFADTVVAAVRGDPLARGSLDSALLQLRAATETAIFADWVTRVLAGADPVAELDALAEPDNVEGADLMLYIAARLDR